MVMLWAMLWSITLIGLITSYKGFMKFNLFLIVVCSLAFFSSCTSEQKESGSSDLESISKLTCEATKLRTARFALADSIRYYQDSLLHPDNASTQKVKEWETNLETMMDRKTRLTAESRNLADTIRAEVLFLTKEMSPEEKRKFNKSLQQFECH